MARPQDDNKSVTDFNAVRLAVAERRGYPVLVLWRSPKARDD